jgi:hypothetical protein
VLGGKVWKRWWWEGDGRGRSRGGKCEVKFFQVERERGGKLAREEKKKERKQEKALFFSPCPTLADQYLPIGATFSGMPHGPYSLLPESYSKKPDLIQEVETCEFFRFVFRFLSTLTKKKPEKRGEKNNNSPSSPTVVRWLRSMPLMNSLMSTTHEVTSLGQPDLSWPKGHLFEGVLLFWRRKKKGKQGVSFFFFFISLACGVVFKESFCFLLQCSSPL